MIDNLDLVKEDVQKYSLYYHYIRINFNHPFLKCFLENVEIFKKNNILFKLIEEIVSLLLDYLSKPAQLREGQSALKKINLVISQLTKEKELGFEFLTVDDL